MMGEITSSSNYSYMLHLPQGVGGGVEHPELSVTVTEDSVKNHLLAAFWLQNWHSKNEK
jgi:hypothetical protein